MFLNLIISFLVEIQDFSLLAFKAILNLFRRPRYIRKRSSKWT